MTSPTKIVIATPTRAEFVHLDYMGSLIKMAQTQFEAKDGGRSRVNFEIINIDQWGQDIIRTRSRMVARFLAGQGTHLLFLDDDVSFDPVVIAGMLAANKNFVGAPYPRRLQPDWERVEKVATQNPVNRGPLEAYAYQYPVRLDRKKTTQADASGCLLVDGIGMGCCLLTREALQQMSDCYRGTLAFNDAGNPAVALFMLLIVDGELLSEDFSFCERYRTMGGGVYCYLGEGSPVDHHGIIKYKGMIEAFGFSRGE